MTRDSGRQDDDGDSDGEESSGNDMVDRDALRDLDAATETPDMRVPEITEVLFLPERGVVRFSGVGAPDSDVVLFVHSDARIVKRIRIDGSGHWQYDHSQKDLYLEPGRHEAYVVALDSDRNLKSVPSLALSFELSKEDAGTVGNGTGNRSAMIVGVAAVGTGLGAALYALRRKRREAVISSD